MKKKKILITGGSGFIGAPLIHRLKTLGHEVASFDAYLNFTDNEAYFKKCLALRRKIYKQPTKIYRADIRDSKKLEKAVHDFRPEIIVHLAGLPMARPLKAYEHTVIPINLTGTINVLEVFEKSTAERVVFTSSSMAYGHFMQTPQSENFILNPVNTYGATKAAGEYFVKLTQKDWVIVRPTSVYGFTDCANRVSQLLIDAAHKGKSAWVVKGETLDFSYVEDVAEGYVAATLKPQASQETFNISTGEARAASEFAEILKQYFPKFSYEVREPLKQQVYRGPQDIQKARKLLGFKPKYSIEKGIKEIVQLAQSHRFYSNI
jgi:nucleoside-diphosphate-sugar epimerase